MIQLMGRHLARLISLSGERLTLPEIGIPDVQVGIQSKIPKTLQVGSLPAVHKKGGDIFESIFIKRSNRYLRFKQSLIVKHINKGDLKRAIKIYFELMASSRAFRIYSMNRVLKGGYHTSKETTVRRILEKVERITKTLDINVDFKRTYIPKTNGKVRPLGVPTPSGRIVNFMIYEILTMILDNKLPAGQFGFRAQRGGLDAGKYLISKAEGKNLYEFDLDSCFNRISLDQTLKTLARYQFPPEFVLFMERYLTMPPKLHFNNVLDEKEIIRPFGSRVLGKRGLPQGFACSPILAIMVIAEAFKKVELDVIMYADDGIVFTNQRVDPFTIGIKNKLKDYGIILSNKNKKDGSSACKFTYEITFLGITGDQRTDKIRLGESWVPRKLVTKRQIIDIIGNGYEGLKKSTEWNWETEKESFMLKRILDNSGNGTNFVNYLKGNKGILRIGLEFIDSQVESMKACNELLKEKRNSPLIGRSISLGRKFAGTEPRNFIIPDYYDVLDQIFQPKYIDRTGVTIGEKIDLEKRSRKIQNMMGKRVKFVYFERYDNGRYLAGWSKTGGTPPSG